ncbi:TRAM domain-containing protein [Halorubrum vacuolatum]|uniref:Predicted RNA-binding protein, contains TRAM domain n=1 Tax=Halorubrum vacuolatum TaxID=63740 RepID=A0A238YD67_HALVU|nr:TRAM domain-containing protein [Halorubrum vacuolatum]SNR68299.1 Predicted RNA-binding protein, contains TRAM domain [Halorubrum vacuolatum]
MVEVPERLAALFSANVEEIGGEYRVTIPKREVVRGEITPRETYRIALVKQDTVSKTATTEQTTTDRSQSQSATATTKNDPPVTEDELRDVTIESVGEQGDGIAKVDHGFVVIVPGAKVGEELTVQIETVQETVAFGEIVTHHSKTH